MSVYLAACVAALSLGQGSAAETKQTLELENCIVSLIDEAQIPAPKAGILKKVSVREGTQVATGDTIAQIDDAESVVRRDIAQRESEAAEKQASNDIDVKFSVAAADVAEAEYDAAVAVNNKVPGTIVAAEVRRLRLAHRRAKFGIEQAEHEFAVTKINAKVRKAHVDGAELDIAQRNIKSTLDGAVVAVHRHEGEWVNVGDPLCRVVRLDRLRVTGFITAKEYRPEEIFGQRVEVRIPTANRKFEKFTGTIGFVSPLVEAGEYRVWAEVDNRAEMGFWLLRPGTTETTMTINLAPAASSAGATASSFR